MEVSNKPIQHDYSLIDISEKQYIVYLLRCADGSLYCGQTNNIHQRIKDHQSSSRSSKYVRSRLPFTLVYTEQYTSVTEALKREYQIKSLTKKQKEELIKNHLHTNKSL